MKNLKIVLLLLAIFGSAPIFAQLQGQAKLDSLLKELPRQDEDTGKVIVLCDVSFLYRTTSIDEGIKYGQQALALATKLEWKKGIAASFINLGVNYEGKLDYTKALEYYHRALTINEEIGNKKGVAVAIGNIAPIYQKQNDLPKAMEYNLKALKLFEELSNKPGIARTYVNIGSNYLKQNDPAKALEYYLKGLRVNEDIGNKSGIATCVANVAIVYQKQSNYSKSLENYFTAMKILEELGDKNFLAKIKVTIAEVYIIQSEYPKALEYLLAAIKLYEETGNKAGIGTTSGDIGIVYKRIGDYSKATEFYAKALKIAEEVGDKTRVAANIHNIGQVYKEKKDYSKALDYYFKALKLDEEGGYKQYSVVVTGNIGVVYRLQKNYLQAVEYNRKAYEMAAAIGDSNLLASNLRFIGQDYLAIAKDTGGSLGKIENASETGGRKYNQTVTIPSRRDELLNVSIDYLRSSIALANRLHDLEEVHDGTEALAEVYKLKGDYKKALEYADSAQKVTKTMFSQDNRDKIASMEGERKQYIDSLKSVEVKRIAEAKAIQRRNYELIGSGVIVLLLGFAFFIVRNRNLLSKEKKQSETLLHNILPEEVAAQLKDTGKSAARQYDNVSVIFTDFVNFTEASERMKPETLIEELDTCFKAFDEITTKYNIEKIKTIGDAYLAVCGLPTADPIHAENVVRAAIEINEFMADRLAKLGSDRTFAVRIGIHTGSVVAGIVGVKKFAYDIWGDTVNTAARMEQNSEAGKINISETTYELVKDKFSCEYRGEVEAKGKGVMKMYFVS